jgi:hypothetical protein
MWHSAPRPGSGPQSRFDKLKAPSMSRGLSKGWIASSLPLLAMTIKNQTDPLPVLDLRAQK